jgi:acyl dehydratase
MSRNLDAAQEDPSLADGLYRGPSRGHTDDEHAELIGLPRAYGYGASMGAWALDYAGHWAGDLGFVRHSNVQYRFPPFEGDVTFVDGKVTGKRIDDLVGAGVVEVELVMTNQDGSVMAKGGVEIQLAG